VFFFPVGKKSDLNGVQVHPGESVELPSSRACLSAMSLSPSPFPALAPRALSASSLPSDNRLHLPDSADIHQTMSEFVFLFFLFFPELF
jgi:hypothetical protein